MAWMPGWSLAALSPVEGPRIAGGFRYGPVMSIPAAPSPADAIAANVDGVIPSRPYPRDLPDVLAEWHVYVEGGGHSIAVVLANLYPGAGDPGAFVAPAPVKSVVRAGWTVENGWIFCMLPYDQDTGLDTPPEDDEF
jgi:hypothetical protein